MSPTLTAHKLTLLCYGWAPTTRRLPQHRRVWNSLCEQVKGHSTTVTLWFICDSLVCLLFVHQSVLPWEAWLRSSSPTHPASPSPWVPLPSRCLHPPMLPHHLQHHHDTRLAPPRDAPSQTYAAQALDNMVAGFNWTTGLEDSFVNAARIESTNYVRNTPSTGWHQCVVPHELAFLGRVPNSTAVTQSRHPLKPGWQPSALRQHHCTIR